MDERPSYFPPVDKGQNRERSEAIIETTRKILERLGQAEKQGLSYAIMGGVALAAWSEDLYSPLRTNNTVRDIDVLILDDPQNELNAVRESCKREGLDSETNPNAPRVSFKVVRSEEYRSSMQLVSMLKRSASGYSFVFRDIEKEIPSKVLGTVDALLKTPSGDIRIKTFVPNTLLHLYIIPIGSVRPKDIEKLTDLARRVARQRDLTTRHDVYKPFHDFAAELRQRYPIHAQAVRLFDLIDRAIFDRFGTHTLPTKLFRALIDL